MISGEWRHLDDCLGQTGGEGSDARLRLGRRVVFRFVLLWWIPYPMLLLGCTAVRANFLALEQLIALSASPVNASSRLLVRPPWAPWWVKDVLVARVLMIVVAWRFVLLWVARAGAAPVVVALLADLDAMYEHGVATVACPAHSHAYRAANEILSASLGRDSEASLVLVGVVRLGLVLSVLGLLWGEPWAGLAALVAAL